MMSHTDRAESNTDATCLFCGEPERVEIEEIWSPRHFQFDTCCEGMHDAACDFMVHEPKAAAAWLRSKGLDALTGRRSRRIIDNGCGNLVIDWNLDIGDITLAKAKAFVLEHHRHCDPPAGWRFGAGIRNGDELIGVVMVGRPVARMLDPKQVLEVNRLCLSTAVTEGLAWNACSMAYGWAAREAKRRNYAKIVTYTRVDEPGTSLIAAGWVVEARTKGRYWGGGARIRAQKGDVIDKLRWTPKDMASAAGLAVHADLQAEADWTATENHVRINTGRGREGSEATRPVELA